MQCSDLPDCSVNVYGKMLCARQLAVLITPEHVWPQVILCFSVKICVVFALLYFWVRHFAKTIAPIFFALRTGFLLTLLRRNNLQCINSRGSGKRKKFLNLDGP